MTAGREKHTMAESPAARDGGTQGVIPTRDEPELATWLIQATKQPG